MTKAEKEHLNAVAELGCCICGGPANIHHVRELASKRDHFKVIPLCHYHHQGKEGLHHMGKKVWREKYGYESEFLDKVSSCLKTS